MKYLGLLYSLILFLMVNSICQTPTPAVIADRGTDPPPPVTQPAGGQSEPRFHGNGRTFFIKASYLFKRSF